MVAHKIVGGASHGDALFQEPHLKAAQVFFPTMVCMGNQRSDGNTAMRGLDQRPLDLCTVKTEYKNLYGFFRPIQGIDKGLNAIFRLNQ